MCTLDYDPASFYTRSTRRARKPYRCDECGRTIEAGELYDYAFMTTNGANDYFRTCTGCLLALEWLKENCHSWMHGGMFEELREHFDGDEQFIWTDGVRTAYSRETYVPTMSKLWVGRVLVSMRKRWRNGVNVAPHVATVKVA